MVLALSPARLVMFSAPRGNSLSAAYTVTGESRRNCFPRLAAGIGPNAPALGPTYFRRNLAVRVMRSV